MSYLARLKALIGENPLPGELTELTKAPSVSSVSNQSGPFCRNESDHGATVIDITAHLAKAQRIADGKNREAARRGETDRFCRCGDLAEHAWRTGGHEIWACDRCKRSFADD
jgi:hypothetical protein